MQRHEGSAGYSCMPIRPDVGGRYNLGQMNMAPTTLHGQMPHHHSVRLNCCSSFAAQVIVGRSMVHSCTALLPTRWHILMPVCIAISFSSCAARPAVQKESRTRIVVSSAAYHPWSRASRPVYLKPSRHAASLQVQLCKALRQECSNNFGMFPLILTIRHRDYK